MWKLNRILTPQRNPVSRNPKEAEMEQEQAVVRRRKMADGGLASYE